MNHSKTILHTLKHDLRQFQRVLLMSKAANRSSKTSAVVKDGLHFHMQ